MQSVAAVKQEKIDPQALHDVVLSAYKALGYPAHVVGSWAISENDIDDFVLLAAAANPKKIIEVGTFVGVSTMLLALACPDAHIFTVDPDFPLSVEMSSAGSGFAGVDHGATTHDIARLVAIRLGVQDRITFVRGGFAVGDTFSSILTKGGEKTPIVGPELCAKEGPFDFAFIDGLHSADAVAADLELVEPALKPGSQIVLHDCIGFWGASVRSGIFEFLRHHPEYVFTHPPYADVYKSVGVLRPRTSDEGLLATARKPINPRSVSPLLIQAFTRMVATLAGHRSVIEVGFGAGILENTYAAESEGYVWAKLKHGGDRPAEGSAQDELAKIVAALDATKNSVIFSADLLDFAPPDLLRRIVKEALRRGVPMVMPITPPGERGVAGPYSRPISALIDMVEEAGGAVYSQPALDVESERYALLPEPRQLGSSSLYASFVVLAGQEGFTDSRSRRLIRLSDIDGAEREQLELQRVHLAAAYRRYYSDRNILLKGNEEAGVLLQRLDRELRSELQLERLNVTSLELKLQLESERARADVAEARAALTAAQVAMVSDFERIWSEIAGRKFRGHAQPIEVSVPELTISIAQQAEAVPDSRYGESGRDLASILAEERARLASVSRLVMDVFDTLDSIDEAMVAQEQALGLVTANLGNEEVVDKHPKSALPDEESSAVELHKLRVRAERISELAQNALTQTVTTQVAFEGTEAALQTTEAALQTTEAALQTTEAALQTTEAALQTTEAALQTTQVTLQTTQATLQEVHASTSWRVTAPLRFFGRVASKATRLPMHLKSFLRAKARGRKLVGIQEKLNSELAFIGFTQLVAPVFDANRYAQEYGDVPPSKALNHYLTFGEAEGRWPHSKFDPSFYRTQYPDVGARDGSMLLHFLQYGLKEGRSPCADLHPLADLARDARVSPLVYYARA
ncbi:MAG: hypothetical protein EON93_00990 [Burkholderiales bacterium]|nr:MAG: hypothetical protein EON93_00990 [Burkholderiales bacterium]